MLANIGRGPLDGSYEALHLISGSGQGSHVDLGQAGQAFGSGHFTTGHRGLGHAGHSPILHGFEQVEIQGGQLGIDVLSTYFAISGTDGHSVFNMYRDISGIGGQGGTDDFSTHFEGSGVGQGEHSFISHGLQGSGLGHCCGGGGGGGGVGGIEGKEGNEGMESNSFSDLFLHPHGLGLVQTLHEFKSSKCSTVCFDFPNKYPTVSIIISPKNRYE